MSNIFFWKFPFTYIVTTCTLVPSHFQPAKVFTQTKSGLRAKSALLFTFRNCVQIQRYINKRDFYNSFVSVRQRASVTWTVPGASKYSDVRNNNSPFILFLHSEAAQRLEGRRWWMSGSYFIIGSHWIALVGECKMRSRFIGTHSVHFAYCRYKHIKSLSHSWIIHNKYLSLTDKYVLGLSWNYISLKLVSFDWS